MNIDLEFDIESEYKSRLKFWDANGNRNSSLGFIPLWFIKDIQGEPAKVGSHFILGAFFEFKEHMKETSTYDRNQFCPDLGRKLFQISITCQNLLHMQVKTLHCNPKTTK